MAASIALQKFRGRMLMNGMFRSKVTLPQRLKEGWFGKAGTYIANILRDYKGATLDIFTDARERPIKATIYIAILGSAAIAAWNNPDEQSYDRSLLDARNDVLLLSDPIRNRASDRHLQGLMELRNQGRIRRLNLVVCCVMWRDDYSKALGRYDSQCEYLRPSWRDFNQRVLDVGLMNRWYYLEKAMVDYDVNDEEFATTDS
ncbi:mitochondrial import inner membrane translocase subunit Tim29-like [Acanthaster planci]|uniref:Mitochondrial import inner membrane translocase subunit Tim29-like n=1 Tax=Acanthaster planci TaxID=133434 RepID=A0A8B7Y269_ACAPL|nr:mitochondrial import inner membrane translocase subunit Tim29-like [Acanthaster planci]